MRGPPGGVNVPYNWGNLFKYFWWERGGLSNLRRESLLRFQGRRLVAGELVESLVWS